MAGSASSPIETHHCSESHGSITAPHLSQCPTRCLYSLTSPCNPSSSSRPPRAPPAPPPPPPVAPPPPPPAPPPLTEPLAEGASRLPARHARKRTAVLVDRAVRVKNVH